MGIVTAKQLKQNTGNVLKRVMAGEKLALTYRGRTIATINPSTMSQGSPDEGLLPYDEAWTGIEEALKTSKPVFSDWKEATAWFRSRSRC